jgi:hAT family C-terminal dimerisation region
LQEHIRRQKNPRQGPIIDEYSRYCLLATTAEMPGGYLLWWKLHESEFPRLAQLARDIFGIPGMLAKVERLFSSAKLMILDN